jgi:hypothetical protein
MNVLYEEYGVQLRLEDDDRLVLDVLCGRIGQYGVEFELNDVEYKQYKLRGDHFIRELIEFVRREPQYYIKRGKVN